MTYVVQFIFVYTRYFYTPTTEMLLNSQNLLQAFTKEKPYMKYNFRSKNETNNYYMFDLYV